MKSSKHLTFLLICLLCYENLILADGKDSINMGSVWVSDNGDGTYSNPVLFSDYSDPDVIRVGEDFYMVSSSFNCVPGLPVLHSKDLVNWSIIGHVFNNQSPDSVYDKPGHGNGVWAPSIRYHNNTFFVCYGDPDFGIYMAKATNPEGPWSHKLVQKAYGWIDACPFWDDDDSAYLVHAYAKSRAGFNSVLTLRRMSRDGESISVNDTFLIFDGNVSAQPRITLEGPKMYKRNGFYYVFAPYGGVAQGKQLVLRSDNIFGPYKDTVVLEQGSTKINGPHQGGWVELESGESWFIHFQEKLPYGRIVHLQPMSWKNDWPSMGQDFDKNGIGEPVTTHAKPNVGKTYPITNPQTSDNFESTKMGLQWQWHSNIDSSWYSLSANPGNLRLNAVALPSGYKNLWNTGSMLLQKLPAEKFSVTTKVNLHLKKGETAGLVIMGQVYSYIGAKKTESGITISQKKCTDARAGAAETEVAGSAVAFDDSVLYLRVNVLAGGRCSFSFSSDGENFTPVGSAFTTDEGRWIGAKVGLMCNRPDESPEQSGYVDFEWFNVDYLYNKLAGMPTNISPVNNSDIVNADISLTWEGDLVLTDTFYIYLDEQPDPVTRIGAQKTLAIKPTGLKTGETYYWRIDAKNDKGVTTGNVWKFKVLSTIGIQENKIFDNEFLHCEPNPVVSAALVYFKIPFTCRVKLELYNSAGELLKIMTDDIYPAGPQEFHFSHADLASGIYFIKMETDDKTFSTKVILI